MTQITTTLRLKLPDDAVFGPGKAMLLELIQSEGSISAAGRRMKMSYKRAWSLVEEMNASFQAPLVESSRGGPSGGGARITDLGVTVLDLYRRLEHRVLEAEEMARLDGLLRVPPAGN